MFLPFLYSAGMQDIIKKVTVSNTGESIFILAVLLAIAGLFEFLPIVDEARKAFPEEWNKSYECYDVLRSRPWYGQVNSWLWFWLISTPIIVFSVKPGTPAWQKICCTLLAIALSYIAINLATHLGMELWNAPFHHQEIIHSNGVLQSSQEEVFKYECFNSADGARYAFAFLFGWVPALIYHGWWEIIWHQYHKRKTKFIDESFKADWINRIVVFISIAIPALIAIYILAR